MIREMKAEMRKLIDNPENNWQRYGSVIDDEPSVIYWHGDRELEIAYQDMDGYPVICRAIYNHPTFSSPYFKAISGPAKGNHMSCVFAFREVEDGDVD